MIDENLEMMLAMQDDEFKKILNSDPVLNKLEDEKYNISEQYFQLMNVFSGSLQINGYIFKTLTLGIWCFMYSIKSPFVVGGKPEGNDIDLMMYLLHEGYEGVSENLFQDSINFCEKHGIEYSEALEFIYKIILISFRPLEMAKSPSPESEPSRYNLDWLTSVVKKVSHCVNCPRNFILYEMSMCQAFYYVIQYMREGDFDNTIRRKNSSQIASAIYRRTFELGKQYYEKNYKNK